MADFGRTPDTALEQPLVLADQRGVDPRLLLVDARDRGEEFRGLSELHLDGYCVEDGERLPLAEPELNRLFLALGWQVLLDEVDDRIAKPVRVRSHLARRRT